MGVGGSIANVDLKKKNNNGNDDSFNSNFDP